MNKKRIEKDTLGSIAIAATKLWGPQTQRSLENFKIGTTLAGTGNKQMSIVTFESVTASGTDDMGKFQFAVDSTGVIEVNDAGITGLLSMSLFICSSRFILSPFDIEIKKFLITL